MSPITGRNGTPVVAIVGWKNSGKTTLTVRLVEELVGRGHRVATVKHAHHAFQIDEADTDSARHRRAGAQQVAVVSAERVAMIRELRDTPEPSLADVLQLLEPSDLVIAEGYKRAPVAKIEARRRASASHEPLALDDPWVIAVAADHETDANGRPAYDLADVSGLATLIEREVILKRGSRAPSDMDGPT